MRNRNNIMLSKIRSAGEITTREICKQTGQDSILVINGMRSLKEQGFIECKKISIGGGIDTFQCWPTDKTGRPSRSARYSKSVLVAAVIRKIKQLKSATARQIHKFMPWTTFKAIQSVLLKLVDEKTLSRKKVDKFGAYSYEFLGLKKKKAKKQGKIDHHAAFHNAFAVVFHGAKRKGVRV